MNPRHELHHAHRAEQCAVAEEADTAFALLHTTGQADRARRAGTVGKAAAAAAAGSPAQRHPAQLQAERDTHVPGWVWVLAVVVGTVFSALVPLGLAPSF